MIKKLLIDSSYVKVLSTMATAEATAIKISPVNMESRQKLGIKAGDTVRVFQKIQEKGKTRLQVFEGLVLARKHGAEAGATFTVRRVASGVGVEKIFPLYSPVIDKIEIVMRSKVRRAKLYHIRKKAAKEIKRQMRHITIMNLKTASDVEDANKAAEESLPENAEADSSLPKEEKKEEVKLKEEAKKAKADKDSSPKQ